MIQYINTIYFSDKDPVILSDSVPHHTLVLELLDSDNARVAAGKREVFVHKCHNLIKSLKDIYPYVVLKKVRTEIVTMS